MLILAAAALAAAVGCDDNAKFMTEQRLDRGMVMILPGIEGPSGINRDIRHGLVAAGLREALPIRSWGNPIPLLGILMKQVDVIGSHLAAAGIRDELVQYMDAHPGAPVVLVGHSGGGGIAVLVAEKMPPGKKLDAVVLLSASISSAHDMAEALTHVRRGIVNFYNRDDGALLGLGTVLLGNIDGLHGPSAGLIGFDPPAAHRSEQHKRTYTKLYQVEIKRDMVVGGDTHTAVTQPGFVASYVAPWADGRPWPATAAQRFVYVPAPPPPPPPPPETQPTTAESQPASP